MDTIIECFTHHFTPTIIYDYRENMRKKFAGLTETLLKQLESGDTKHMFLSGSTVEGANLARLFGSPDAGNGFENEVEIDIMYPILCLDNVSDGCKLQYVDQSPVHVHVQLADNAVLLDRIRTACFGSDPSFLDLFRPADDSSVYLCPTDIRERLFNLMTEPVGRLFRYTKRGRAVVDVEFGLGNAPFTYVLDYREDKTKNSNSSEKSHPKMPTGRRTDAELLYHRTADKFALQTEQLDEIFGDDHGRCCLIARDRMIRYIARSKRLLERVEQVEGELKRMVTEGASLWQRVVNAKEWTQLCVKATDLMFVSLQRTAGWLMKKTFGIDWVTPAYEPLKMVPKYRDYATELNFSEEVLNVASVRLRAERVLSTIYSIDISTKRIPIALRANMLQLEDVLEMFDQPGEQLGYGLQTRLKQFGDRMVQTVSFDFVPCVQLTTWPSTATEWITRRRLWPNSEVITAVANKGAYLVNKPFCHEDIDWRLSFSVAECYIAGLWTLWQHFIYFVFKSLFYKFVKCLNKNASQPDVQNCDHTSIVGGAKKYVTSYIAKTVMLHVSENFPQSWWSEDNAGECLSVLLSALQSAYESRRLEHYFVSSFNLLHGIPDELANMAAEAVQRIQVDPTLVAPQLESHFAVVTKYVDAMDAQVTALDKFKELPRLLDRLLVSPVVRAKSVYYK